MFRTLRSGLDKAVYYCRLAKGSEPTYTIEFDDNTTAVTLYESLSRLDPEKPDFHHVDHMYEVPGNYVAFVKVENIFGNIRAYSNDKVFVQNPLGHKFILVPDSIAPVPYPPGNVTFGSQLTKNTSHSFLSTETVPPSGWANHVHAKWYLSKLDWDTLLLQSYGKHEIGK